jgi:ABC-2 type transport system permease protein
MRNLFLISKEDFINLIKNPMWVFYNAVFPVLLVAIIGFLTRESYGNDVTSYDYYGITLMVYSILSSGMTSANSFMEERIRKANMRIIYAPGNVKSIYLSKILSSFCFLSICHLLDIVILCLLYNIHISSIPQMLVLFVLIEFFSVSLGVMLCCIFKTEAMANQILSMVINIFAILGGLFFPLDGYGKAARIACYISPVKWLVKTTFSIIYDKDFSGFYPTVLIMIISISVVIIVCDKTFRKEDCIC